MHRVNIRASDISRGSGKSAKSCEIRKNTQNTAKFGRNLIKYMSVQQFWNLSQLLGVLQFTCCKIANLCQNFVTETCKLPGIEYVAKNWALAMMLKALPLFHFWSVLLLKEQMMTSVRKTLKTLVWSAQNRSISSEICPENNHKIRRFFTDCFPAKFAPKIPAKSADFPGFVPENPGKFDFFSTTYQKPCNIVELRLI